MAPLWTLFLAIHYSSLKSSFEKRLNLAVRHYNYVKQGFNNTFFGGGGGGGVHCIEAALWAAKLKVKGQYTYSQASKYLIMVVLSKLSPSMVKLTKLGKLIV